MGVPGFYRWAVRRVPGVVHKGSRPPYEFDCLYLDFNGVVHGCMDAWTGQEREDVVFQLIEAEIILLIGLAQPRVLLFIALDGVAPRAKMNQQRSRRFRAAQDAHAASQTVEGAGMSFDRNAITPGTAFMVRLTNRLYAWAEANAQGPLLRGVTVVVSGDRDPGEGEHKIMDVIRHHPNYTHCLVSSDADLVFLGLVSPAEHVYLLRYNQRSAGSRTPAADAPATPALVAPSNTDGAEGEGEEDDGAEEGGAAEEEQADTQESNQNEPAGSSDYELLSITAVRRYLAGQFPGRDLQRLSADFVAMCCLAGNDFLPHIPAVDIYQGGIDKLLTAYRNINPGEGRYLVEDGDSLAHSSWRLLLEQFAQAEAEALLDEAGLGLGPRMPPYRGPGPPNGSWDGLSILVLWAPPRVLPDDVVASLSKQGCVATVALPVRSRHGPRGPTTWLVRFADARSAVKTLIANRRIWGSKVTLSWVDPSSCDLMEHSTVGWEAVSWKAELDEVVRECFEFWLGPDNLPNDAFLRRHVRYRADRFVPVKVFTRFPRMQVLLQDCNEIVRILRTSSHLEVMGEGDQAMVRGVHDHSRRPDENPAVVARQQEAASKAAAGDHLGAALALRHDYYGKHAGPLAAGGPQPGDLPGTERHRAAAFLQGIEWVLRYYIQGCSSWSWFYPAHYPPLCVSLLLQAEQPIERLPLHAPFPPELQLLAVLPPLSAGLLPEPLRRLLLHPESPVAEFYPSTFQVDLKEGDKEWQAIVLLPFVDEHRLRAALNQVRWDGGSSSSEPARAFRCTDVAEPPVEEAHPPPALPERPSAFRKLGAVLRQLCTPSAVAAIALPGSPPAKLRRPPPSSSSEFRLSEPLAPGRSGPRAANVSRPEECPAPPPREPREGGGGGGNGKGRGKWMRK